MNKKRNILGKILLVLFLVFTQVAQSQPSDPPGGGGPGGGPVGVPLDGSDIFILVFAGLSYFIYRHIKEIKSKKTIHE